MFCIGIDIGKFKHAFSVFDSSSGEVLLPPTEFSNDHEGFALFYQSIKPFKKKDVLIGMEDTGHYHFALLQHLLQNQYQVALINPIVTDLTRKLQGNISKNDRLDFLTICDVIAPSFSRKKHYRIFKLDRFDLYEQRTLTREHHNLKEQLNTHMNRLQKSIDVVFPEFNSLFKSKYGTVYMSILKRFQSASTIASTDIRTLRHVFNLSGRGKRISLTPEELKAAAKKSIGIDSIGDEIRIKHLISQIELINEQIEEIDKKIEEFSLQTNSPILSIPGISHFSGTSILAELGNIGNYSSAKQIIKYAGVAPYEHQSGEYNANHMAITKKGSKYLRKTLYQIILPVIQHNAVFKYYFQLKISQGKSFRCAQGHCIRKLLRIIYHLETSGQPFEPSLLR